MEKNVLIHVLAVTALLLVALVLATKFGLIYCGSLPFWCEGYRTIMSTVLQRNYPAVLILYGEKGLGDPDTLYKYFLNDCRVYIEKKNIHAVRSGNLERFDFVIVTRARELSATELEMLWDFVAGGGKLVFIADSGVDSPENDFLTYEDLGEKNKTGIPNRWDRKKEDGTIISFGSSVLGLKYIGDHCSECNAFVFSGRLVLEKDLLTDGVPASVPLYSNYTVVESMGGSVFGPHTVVGTIDRTSGINGTEPPYPAIIWSARRIIYFAFPPEYLLNKKQIEDTPQAGLILRNLCEWMKGG